MSRNDKRILDGNMELSLFRYQSCIAKSHLKLFSGRQRGNVGFAIAFIFMCGFVMLFFSCMWKPEDTERSKFIYSCVQLKRNMVCAGQLFKRYFSKCNGWCTSSFSMFRQTKTDCGTLCPLTCDIISQTERAWLGRYKVYKWLYTWLVCTIYTLNHTISMPWQFSVKAYFIKPSGGCYLWRFCSVFVASC